MTHWSNRYKDKLDEGKCPRCGDWLAIRNIMQAGKLVESRVMSACYGCLQLFKKHYVPHGKKRHIRRIRIAR